MWCLLKGALPILDVLRHKHVVTESVCPVCKCCDESIMHVFHDCHFVRITRAISPLSNKLLNSDSEAFGSGFCWCIARQQQRSLNYIYVLVGVYATTGIASFMKDAMVIQLAVRNLFQAIIGNVRLPNTFLPMSDRQMLLLLGVHLLLELGRSILMLVSAAIHLLLGSVPLCGIAMVLFCLGVDVVVLLYKMQN